AAGEIDPTIFIAGGGDLIRQDGRPEWKWSASATWSYDQWQVGAFTQYISSLYDDSVTNAANEPWTVDATLTGNLYGEYQFEDGGL
ncbi:hypothetical protein ABTO78_21040, partial [Acinetobacter baumannii]